VQGFAAISGGARRPLRQQRGAARDLIAKAIGTVARAQGMSAVADSAGVSRETLCRALSGNRGPSSRQSARCSGRSGFDAKYPKQSFDLSTRRTEMEQILLPNS